jgi:hypothetical protein
MAQSWFRDQPPTSPQCGAHHGDAGVVGLPQLVTVDGDHRVEGVVGDREPGEAQIGSTPK